MVVDWADGRRVDRPLSLVRLQLLQRVSVPQNGAGVLKNRQRYDLHTYQMVT